MGTRDRNFVSLLATYSTSNRCYMLTNAGVSLAVVQLLPLSHESGSMSTSIGALNRGMHVGNRQRY